jgi:SnoaL-like domain
MGGADDLQRRVEALEKRLDAALAVQEIQRLKARYAALVDARYTRGAVVDSAKLGEIARDIADLFTEDATWDGGRALGVAQGRGEIAARMGEPTLLFSRHYFVQPRIEVEGDLASARWDLLAPCTTKDGRPHWMAGVEDDTYRRVGGRWLHQSMRLSVVFLAPHEVGWEKVLV